MDLLVPRTPPRSGTEISMQLCASTPAKSARSGYSPRFRRGVVTYARVHPVRKTMAKFCTGERRGGQSPSRSTLWRWRKKAEQYLALSSEKRRRNLPGQGRKPILSHVLEEKLYERVMACRSDGHAVRGGMLREWAAAEWQGLNLEGTFSASSMWLRRYLNRHHLSVRRRTTTKLPPPDMQEKLDDFFAFYRMTIEKRRIDPTKIWNMDEISIAIESPSTTTIDAKGTKSVPISTGGHEHEHVSVALCCAADGCKMNPFVIRRGPPNISLTHPDVFVAYQAKGYMDSTTFRIWLEEMFSRKVPSGSILVMDSAPAHRSSDSQAALRRYPVAVAMIPGGLTPVLQPLDIAPNRCVKAKMTSLYSTWRASRPAGSKADGRPRWTTVYDWISAAWNSVSPQLIRASFCKAGLWREDGVPEDAMEEQVATAQKIAEAILGAESGDEIVD